MRNIIFIIAILVLLGCISSLTIFDSYAAGSRQNNTIKITEKEIEPFKYPMTFIVRFSAIVYETKGKNIKIPIFQGNYGEIKYKDLIDYAIEKKYIDQNMWVAYIIKCKKGEIRQTLHELLKFYKSNILKNVDVDNFNNASLTSTEWTITYDFMIEGVPGYLEIQFDPRAEDVDNEPKYKSVYEIIPEEKVKDPNILYTFVIGVKSTDR